MEEQLVVGVEALLAQDEGVVDRREQRPPIERPRQAHRRRGELLEAIPVVVEYCGDVLERRTKRSAQFDAATPQPNDEWDVSLVVLPAVDVRVPAVLEGQDGLHFVEHLDARWDGHLDRVFAQQSMSEPVQRGDRRGIEVGEGVGTSFGGNGVVGPGPVVERPAHPIAQLGGCRFRKRDGRQVA